MTPSQAQHFAHLKADVPKLDEKLVDDMLQRLNARVKEDPDLAKMVEEVKAKANNLRTKLSEAFIGASEPRALTGGDIIVIIILIVFF